MKLGIIIVLGTVLIAGTSLPDTPLGWFDKEATGVGFAFLKLEIGGRPVGMGGAYSAVCDDATSSYWNPAGLMRTEGGDVCLHHNEHIQGLRQEYLGLSFTGDNQGFGLGVSGLYADDLELRKGAQEEPDGYFGSYDFSLSFSYGRDISDEFALGFTLKGLHERLYLHTATGWALDIGGHYLTPLKGLSLGCVVQNLGPKLEFSEEKLRLPNTYRVGLSYLLPARLFNGRTLLAVDAVKSIDSPLRANLGAEYDYREALRARMGYKLRYDALDLSFGVGFGLGRYSLDYAFIPYGYDLGSGHLVTLKLGF